VLSGTFSCINNKDQTQSRTMETPREYYYTYYSYEEWGRGYIGSRGCKCLPEEDIKYFGSYSDKTFNPTQKIILEIYGTREQAIEAEVILHDFYDVANNPHFANRAKQTSTKFYIPTEKAKQLGKKCGDKYGTINGKKIVEEKIGIFGLTEDEKKLNSSKGGKVSGNNHKKNNTGVCGLSTEEKRKYAKLGSGGKKVKELGVGIFELSEEEREKNSSKGGQKCYELKLGIYNLSYEEKFNNCSKGGKKAKELGIGVHNISPTERIEINKRVNETNKKNNTGIYSLSLEQRIENGKKSSKIMNSQKWECLETGYITTSGPLTLYQKAKGIDTSKRRRIT